MLLEQFQLVCNKSLNFLIFSTNLTMNSQLNEIHNKNNARNLIDKFEILIRLFIEDGLKNYYKDSWWESGIPLRIRTRISEFQNNIKKQEPKKIYKRRDSFIFNEYKDIIFYKKNWINIFENVFHEKTNVSFPFNKLRLLRNDLSHARKLNKKDFRKIEIYSDDILKYIPTEFTKEDLVTLNIENQVLLTFSHPYFLI